MPLRIVLIIGLAIAGTVLGIDRARAGGSGLNVIVVVNQNSTNSVQLGNDYCERRGVPPQNVLRLTNWTGGSINWSPDDFQTQLLNPLLDMVAARGLAPQARFVLLSMDIPYRVTDGNNVNSTTSALFYGFKTNGPPVSGFGSCSLPDETSNSYAYSELPWGQAPPNTAITNSFLAMMLTDTNLATAEATLARGVAADFSHPTQTVYLEKTSDPARNVRFVEFDNSVFDNRVAGNTAVTRIQSDSTAFTNLFGLLTGLANFSPATNAFVPGGLGDSLTSFGGYLLEDSGQTSALAFLEAGAGGSYGTVVEPCNYPQKFPDAIDYFYQTRGFSLSEAYYQSVLNPFQGLLVGEPLAAPFAQPGSANWTTLTNGAGLSGTATLSLAFAAAGTNLPLAQADLFVDGTFLATMTNLPPTEGNMLTVVLNGSTVNYLVPANATVAGIAAGLANLLNLQSALTRVQATAVGDRIELQSLQLSVPGSNVTVSAGAAAGLASALTTRLAATRPAFLDTVAAGYQVLTVVGAPQTDDWMQVTLTKTNGTQMTLAVTNSAGGTAGDLALALINLINATPALQGADGAVAGDLSIDGNEAQFNLYARAPGWPASQILDTFTTSPNLQSSPSGANPLADNVSDLRPRNHLYVSSGATGLEVNYACNTLALADGYHELTAVAYEGTSVATQTRTTRAVILRNTSLMATLAALPAGSNATPGQTLRFTVAANANNIAQIELFSTGGSLGVVSNQSTAVFTVPADYLGPGLHPFYAVVADPSGNRYRTQTVWYRIEPAIDLTISGSPPTLRWAALPNRQYAVQASTNLLNGFQTVDTVTATNPVAVWPVTTGSQAMFYRVAGPN